MANEVTPYYTELKQPRAIFVFGEWPLLDGKHALAADRAGFSRRGQRGLAFAFFPREKSNFSFLLLAATQCSRGKCLQRGPIRLRHQDELFCAAHTANPAT